MNHEKRSALAVFSLGALGALGFLAMALNLSAQVDDRFEACLDTASVWNRYLDALGGQQALGRLETRIAEARETEPSSFNPRATNTYNYSFEWKSPNQAVMRFAQSESLFGIPLSFGKTRFIFDGAQWSDFRGRANPREARPGQPFRVFPTTLDAWWRVISDPLFLARPGELYTRFDPANDFASYPDRCILKAYDFDGRVDFLHFDLATGLLRAWRLELRGPRRSSYITFFFDDYRQTGEVKFPFYIYSDYYRATFRFTKVVHNRPLPDSDFVFKR